MAALDKKNTESVAERLFGRALPVRQGCSIARLHKTLRLGRISNYLFYRYFLGRGRLRPALARALTTICARWRQTEGCFTPALPSIFPIDLRNS